jgi:hypothetical protein
VGLIREIGKGPLALDTAIFIYFIEEHPRFLPVLDLIFAAIDAGRLPAVASSLTLLEVLVIPYSAGTPRSPNDTSNCSREAAASVRSTPIEPSSAPPRNCAPSMGLSGLRTPSRFRLHWPAAAPRC